ncbi:TraB/GumN family protein [Hoeflea poritis]|uniref:TraB/GumN family protein n=1 Tax=Hoeflea poritis TaxID=2993659 RepID=A0ABT4VLW2_9HYPH|nr:TraB/GumN family protein [Hoeflea poritis]MDA4845589.1 TraB/GumN family protein [Hoeflea poritis]
MTFISPPLERIQAVRINWGLAAAVVLHLIFLLSFVAALLLATQRANAQDVACRGENLVEIMARDNPDRLAEIRQKAAATPNGDSLLWRIEHAGAEPSWLYGTMHATDPRVLEMSDAARSAFDGAQTIVVESSEITNLEGAMASLMTDPSLTMLGAGETLQSLLEEADLAEVETVLKQRGVPITFVSRMQPWMVFSLISVPECELVRRGKGISFLDKKLADDALEQGKSLKGLETLKEQLSVLSGLPLDVQARLLVDTATLGDLLEDVTATMTELYLDGQVGMIMPLVEATTIETDTADTGAYAEFEKNLVLKRNHTMAERVLPILDEGNAFVAVGALHLPGEEGLVALLRDRGYTVTAVR